MREVSVVEHDRVARCGAWLLVSFHEVPHGKGEEGHEEGHEEGRQEESDEEEALEVVAELAALMRSSINSDILLRKCGGAAERRWAVGAAGRYAGISRHYEPANVCPRG